MAYDSLFCEGPIVFCFCLEYYSGFSRPMVFFFLLGCSLKLLICLSVCKIVGNSEIMEENMQLYRRNTDAKKGNS